MKISVMVEVTSSEELARVLAALAPEMSPPGSSLKDAIIVKDASPAAPASAPLKGKYAGHPNLRTLVAAIRAEFPSINAAGMIDKCHELRQGGESPVLEAIAAEDLDDRVENAFLNLGKG